MTDDRFARRLPDLMHELAGGDDRYIDDILARTADTRQRPAWTFPARWLPAPTLLDRLPAYQNRLVVILLLVAMLALLVATAALVGGLRRPELPTSRASNGSVAVSANPNDVAAGEVGDIYLLDEGGPVRRIIGSDDDGIAQACPSFSPDGRRLAYGESRAFLADGRGFRDRSPVSDRAVVVVELDSEGSPSAPMMRVALSAQPGEMACPEWSPSAAQLAFRSGGELWVADTASGDVTVVPVGVAPWGQGDFEWSRDGSRIAVAEPGLVRIVPVGGGDSTALPVGATIGGGNTPGSLGWAAGDDRIFYTSTDGPGDGLAINAVGVDGSNNKVLTSGVAGLQVRFDHAVVSPAGTELAYIQATYRCTTDGCMTQPDRVLVIDQHGSNGVEVPVPPGFGVSGLRWSPDGERLLLSSIDGVVSVPVAPGSGATFYAHGELNLEWSPSETTWQPVFPLPQE